MSTCLLPQTRRNIFSFVLVVVAFIAANVRNEIDSINVEIGVSIESSHNYCVDFFFS